MAEAGVNLVSVGVSSNHRRAAETTRECQLG